MVTIFFNWQWFRQLTLYCIIIIIIIIIIIMPFMLKLLLIFITGIL